MSTAFTPGPWRVEGVDRVVSRDGIVCLSPPAFRQDAPNADGRS